MSESQTHLRICPLCEATCGLELATITSKVHTIRGDHADTFSEGYLCPKGVALKDLHTDPDRLRSPMIRRNGSWQASTWDDAFTEIERKLLPLMAEHGRNSVGMYLGNPVVHNTALTLYGPLLRRALGSRNVFTASSVDQVPKQLAVGLMFGDGLSVPVPDIDRCDYLLVIGANPLVSNGSLMTAPNVGERLKRLRRRGGRMIVIDPCRTKTAAAADRHHFIRPGTDALLLFAIVHTLFAEDLTSPGRLDELTNGVTDVQDLAQPFSPEVVAERCGIDANTIRGIAREIAAASSAAVYGRIGTCTQEFGTLASWLAEVIHVLTGNLDREGGAMFTLAAHGPVNSKNAPGSGRGFRTGKWNSRVRGCPEIFNEFPAACLSEEIETPGDDQIRALITVAGNPVLSTPNGQRLSRALESLEFMVSLDLYLNETSRHADVILPGLSPLENSHYDIVFSQLAIRNYARFSSAVFPVPEGLVPEWHTILRLTGLLSERPFPATVAAGDEAMVQSMIDREIRPQTSTIHGRDAGEILEQLKPRVGPERIVDFMLRTGPYGDAFGANPDGLNLSRLEKSPHGIDLGPLKPRIPELLRTPSGKIELAPPEVVRDVDRLRSSLTGPPSELVLIGRRQLRSNNSWMHNLQPLISGKPRCTLQIHPDDAERYQLQNGDLATVDSRVGTLDVPVEIQEDMMPGVVSIPHGWGHGESESRLQVAATRPGVNSNLLADEDVLDEPSGNAVLCGIPVSVKPCRSGS